MHLREIAHSRSGDKGDTSNISVIAYDPRDYELIAKAVTAARVKQHFAGVVRGEVLRYELPQLGALNFVMHRALHGGVTRSLALDAHGKCLSSVMLGIEIPDEMTAAAPLKPRERRLEPRSPEAPRAAFRRDRS